MPFRTHDPLLFAGWDDHLTSDHPSSFFHTSAWAATLAGAYHYKPVYLAAFDRHHLEVLLPLMEIDSLLTGKRGVSLPFTDCCPILAQSQDQLRALVQAALEYAADHRWRSIEFRVDQPLPIGQEPACEFRSHTIYLDSSLGELRKKIRESTLRNAHNAEKSGVHTIRSRALPALRTFYRLNCMTRKRHGLPPQPWYFFWSIFHKILQSRRGDVFIASYRDIPIAGAHYLHFGKHVIYKFGASNGRFHHLRANNLLMWKAIQFYYEHGSRTIDLGRTEIGHKGLLQYKRGWGARESSLYYYRYDFRRKAYQRQARTLPPGYNLFRKLPISALRVIGHWLYPHLG